MNFLNFLDKDKDKDTHGCSFSGPGRGDCFNFIGLPGRSITGQHDGDDDTVDCYGKPNGWCWWCWRSHQVEKYKSALYNGACSYGGHNYATSIIKKALE